MSQVTFKTTLRGKPIEVMAGWDRPLQDYFLTIFALDSDEEEVLWSTLEHPSPEDKVGTKHLQAKLVDMGITAPDGFWERVHRQEGNHIYMFKT